MKNNIISVDEYIERLKEGSVKRVTYVMLKEYLKLFQLEAVYFETRDVFLIHNIECENDTKSVTVEYSLPCYFKKRIDKEANSNKNISKELIESYEFLSNILKVYFNKYDE